MASPLISVIVLNFNGRRWLPGCLDALARQQGAAPFEVILVDNGSADGSAAFVRATYPNVRVIETGANVGFAAGNNAGARVARGEQLAFLNNDTVAAPDWLERLYAGMRQSACALVTSRIVVMDTPDIADSAGDGYLRAGGAFKRGHREPANRYDASAEVFGVCGAACMIRRDVFESLGGFAESLFVVYEDVDLSYRARLRGHRCWYAADATVRHAGSATLGRMSPTAVFYGQRNLEWVWIRNTPWPAILTSLPSHLLYSLAGVVHYARTGLGGAAIRGKLAALAGLPRVLSERATIQGTRTAPVAQLTALMTSGWLRTKRAEKRARSGSQGS